MRAQRQLMLMCGGGGAWRSASQALTFEPVKDRKTIEPKIEELLQETEKRQGLLNLPPCNKRIVSIAARKSDGRIAGGLYGYSNWNEIHISLLAASTDVPAHGTGKALLRYVEEIVCPGHGCNRIGLETFSWQARPFYEKFGFSLFGVQENQPRGQKKYFMEKVWNATTERRPETPNETLSRVYGEQKEKLLIGDWPCDVAWTQLNEWLESHTQRLNIEEIPRYDMTPNAMKVVDDSGRDVAFCVYETWWNEIHVDKLVVLPDRQHCGIGAAVLRHVEEVAQSRGIEQLVADTMSWQATGFYEKHGFAIFATQADLPKGYQRYRLRKLLK